MPARHTRLASFLGAKKIERLIGLDRCREILSWPLADSDPPRLSLKMQVLRIVPRICVKAISTAASIAKSPGSASGHDG
jgi:hypothetical protein